MIITFYFFKKIEFFVFQFFLKILYMIYENIHEYLKTRELSD